MNKQEQRIAIAEACGGTTIHCLVDGWLDQDGNDIPDYCNDLNAMHHEAEKIIYDHINPIIPFTFEWILDDIGAEHKVHATAAQRAEAFLKTLNLWKTP